MTPRQTRAARLRRTVFGALGDPDQLHLTDILRQETVGGLLMLAAAIAALVWANVDAAGYAAARDLPLGPLTLQHWMSDGLLTIFFFVVGLELRRELAEGSLSRPADALVPIVAAIGGMATPALLYAAVNFARPDGDLRGWAVPMATDIAFALAVLAIVGSQLPNALRAFLLTLAVVDDLGAIVVIAVFFSTDLRLAWLLGAAGCALAWWLLQRVGVDHAALFIPLAVVAWWCTLRSGIHPTIAGVVLGLLTRTSAAELNDPVDRWEHAWRPVSAGVAVPLFALFAAGVPIDARMVAGLVTQPVTLGIVAGLVLGKPIGIVAGAWLTARFTSAELGQGVRWRDVGAVGVLGGMGFTVSLLVAELAFARDSAQDERAKAAVLTASLLAAVIGGLALRRRNRRHARALDSR